MEHQKQHWIPRSYLKAWCDPTDRDAVVHVYEPDGKYRGRRAPSRIFTSEELYTVFEAGARDLRTEKGMKFIEDEFLKVRRAIDRKRPLPAGSKRTLACYVAAMRNRSPAARDHWQSFMNRVVEVGDELAVALANTSPDRREKMVRATSLAKADRHKSMTLEEAKEAAAEPFGRWVVRHIALEMPLLEQMSFAIMRAPDGFGFITSDSPVVWHDAAPPEKRSRHIGLANPFIEVSMPLTPRYCLLFDHVGKDGFCDVSQHTVALFNSRTLAQCNDCFVPVAVN